MTLRVFSEDETIWTLAPHGRLDLPAARAMEDALNDLADAGHARVIVDFSDVVYVASAGLKVLLAALRRARLLQGDVRLSAMSDHVREVFEMAGFDQVFAIHPTAADAVASFKS